MKELISDEMQGYAKGYQAALDDMRDVLRSHFDIYKYDDELHVSPWWYLEKLQELKEKQNETHR